MRPILLIILMISLFSCYRKDYQAIQEILENTDDILIEVSGQNGMCLSRHLTIDEVATLRKLVNMKSMDINPDEIFYNYHLIAYKNGVRIGDIFLDSVTVHVINSKKPEQNITFPADQVINYILDSLMNVKEIDCSISSRTVHLDKITVKEFIDTLKIKDPNPHGVYRIRTFGQSDTNWISEGDIEQLIRYIDSNQKSYCIIQTLSSTIPKSYDYSTLGGQVMDIIDSYRLKKSYPLFLYSCTKNDENRQKEILEWWSKINN